MPGAVPPPRAPRRRRSCGAIGARATDVARSFLLWLPPLSALDGSDAPADVAWLRVDDGVIVDSGQDDGWVDAWERSDDAVESDDRLIALAPAADVPLRWHHFPDARSEEHTSELQSLMRIS